MYNWDTPKNLLDSGDLDIIFKVTAVEKLKIHYGGGVGHSHLGGGGGLDICFL